MRYFVTEYGNQFMLSQPLATVQTVTNHDHDHVQAQMFQPETFTTTLWCAYVVPMHACAPRH